MQNSNNTKAKGNYSLVSKEEEMMAAMLREKNLAFTNSISAPVTPRNTIYTRWGKRMLDIAISLPVCLFLLPLYAVFAICTYFDVGKPILYKQTRCGKDGRTFTMAKFRNMNNKTDADGRLLPAAQRVTKFGKFMRKTSLDELTNFWNVLIGDMSLIGPRPLPVFYHERMSDRHKMRSAVRPGLECPRMIVLDDKEAIYQLKFENDIWYVENISFLTDLKMLFMLVKMTLDSKTRGAHASSASYFVGYDEKGYAIGMRRAKERYGTNWNQEKVSG